VNFREQGRQFRRGRHGVITFPEMRAFECRVTVARIGDEWLMLGIQQGK
jgi:hypothetical protein